MANAVILSIPYTGTNFTADLFAKAGYEVLGLHQRPGREKFVRRAHCLKESQIGPALGAGLPLVVPMRHPYRVAESWARRGGYLPDMVRAYRTVVERLLPHRPFFMPVDSDRRGEYLERLRELEPKLSTDWEVVGSKSNTYDLSLEDISPKPEVIELVRDIAPFLSRFYEVQSLLTPSG